MKVFGWVILVGAVAVGALYATGNIDGKVNANLTSKGKQNINTGLEKTKQGINSGLDSLKTKVQEQVNKD